MVALLALIALASEGCAGNPHPKKGNALDSMRSEKASHDITKSEAIEIALNWAAKGWPKDKLEAGPATMDQSAGWIVDVWRLPKTPGGFVVIYISVHGEIVRVWGGA
jgi:hypothetical protein